MSVPMSMAGGQQHPGYTGAPASAKLCTSTKGDMAYLHWFFKINGKILVVYGSGFRL